MNKNALDGIKQVLKANKHQRFNGHYGYTINETASGFRIKDNDLADSIAIDLKAAGYNVLLEVGKTSLLVKVNA